MKDASQQLLKCHWGKGHDITIIPHFRLREKLFPNFSTIRSLTCEQQTKGKEGNHNLRHNLRYLAEVMAEVVVLGASRLHCELITSATWWKLLAHNVVCWHQGQVTVQGNLEEALQPL